MTQSPNSSDLPSVRYGTSEPNRKLTPRQQLDLLDSHPVFTGRCPNCEMPLKFEVPPQRWSCAGCGWEDEGMG